MNPKKLAAGKAAGMIKDGMLVGLGTGSTAAFAIEAIGKLVKTGISIKAVASSIASEKMAQNSGIQIIPFAEVESIDLYIDGADEIDTKLNLIKGGGGALLREKVLAYHSRHFIVIADSTKLVPALGRFPLAVEITLFASWLTMRTIEKLGCTCKIRMKGAEPFLTDNGNLIIDCDFKNIPDPAKLDHQLQNIPGVVENGIFLNDMVSQVIVGYENGELKVFPDDKVSQITSKA